MFTGIIKCVGTVLAGHDAGGDTTLTIGYEGLEADGVEPGSSIAVNGVCLTATRCGSGRFEADISRETLSVTTLGDLREGSRVNLEPALRIGDRLDGHWVAGHVDGVGEILDVRSAARSSVYTVRYPAGLGRYIAHKGSVAVDGVSLTVNDVRHSTFEINLVPHTLKLTLAAEYGRGSAVNIEVDMVARYLERLVQSTRSPGGLSIEKLQEHGYAEDH